MIGHTAGRPLTVRQGRLTEAVIVRFSRLMLPMRAPVLAGLIAIGGMLCAAGAAAVRLAAQDPSPSVNAAGVAVPNSGAAARGGPTAPPDAANSETRDAGPVRLDLSSTAPVGATQPLQGRLDARRSGLTGAVIPAAAPVERWRYCTGGPITGSSTVAPDGTVLLGSHDRFVYALHPNGSLRWRFRTGDLVWSSVALTSRTEPGKQSGLLAVVGSDDDKLYGLWVSDGTLAFATGTGACKRQTGIGPEASRCDVDDVTQAPSGQVFVGGEAISAYSQDGKLVWTHQPDPTDPHKLHCLGAPAVAKDGGVVAACQDQVIALSPEGNLRWQVATQGELSAAPAIGPDDTVYFGDDSRRLSALDGQGVARFSFISGAPIRGGVALRADGVVIFGALDGVIYAVRPDGSLLWSYQTGDAIVAAPIVDASGAVLVGSRDNRLYALHPDGRLRWSHVLEHDIDGPATLLADGTIYVGSDDFCLHALR